MRLIEFLSLAETHPEKVVKATLSGKTIKSLELEDGSDEFEDDKMYNIYFFDEDLEE